jgi:hypothetical protein
MVSLRWPEGGRSMIVIISPLISTRSPIPSRQLKVRLISGYRVSRGRHPLAELGGAAEPAQLGVLSEQLSIAVFGVKTRGLH